MSILIAAGCSAAETPGDLRVEVKQLASRKVLRFLDAASFAPFAMAVKVYRENPVCPPEDVALYTLSGWDGDMPDQPFTPDGSTAQDTELSKHILEDANPVVWLRMLANNALCQVSIAEGFRGPNAHFVGDAPALGHALAAAVDDLRSGAAGLALIVAYDPAPEARRNPSGRAPTRAAAIALTEGAGIDLTARLFELTDRVAATGGSALTAIESCLADQASSAALRSAR